MKILIHACRHIIIITGGKEETEKSKVGRAPLRDHWAADICYNWSELWLNFKTETDKAAVNDMQYPISLMSCMLHCW